jgi:hypothetical protein
MLSSSKATTESNSSSRIAYLNPYRTKQLVSLPPQKPPAGSANARSKQVRPLHRHRNSLERTVWPHQDATCGLSASTTTPVRSAASRTPIDFVTSSTAGGRLEISDCVVLGYVTV